MKPTSGNTNHERTSFSLSCRLARLRCSRARLPAPAQARSLDAIRRSARSGFAPIPTRCPSPARPAIRPDFRSSWGSALAQRARRLAQARLDHHPVPDAQRRLRHRDGLIADREAQGETNLQDLKTLLSHGRRARRAFRQRAHLVQEPRRAYQGRGPGRIHGGDDLGQRHVPTSTFGFEVDSLEALANHEIDAAAVTPTMAGYFNLTHPQSPVRISGLDESEANLNWNVAVGMVRPDDKLRNAINDALDHLRADGTVERIYARYGIVLQAPKYARPSAPARGAAAGGASGRASSSGLRREGTPHRRRPRPRRLPERPARMNPR